jgi:hypothetical protein
MSDPVGPDTRDESSDDPEEIRREIERTQGELGGTIDAIQEKLSPGALLEDARGPVEETSEHIVGKVQQAVQESVDHLLAQAREPAEEIGDHLIARATSAAEEAAEQLVAKATTAVEDATDHILDQARLAATETAASIVEQTGQAMRAATIGKVEKLATRIQQASENANEASKGLGSIVIRTVKSNPLPATMAAIGLGWLYLRRPDASPRYDGNQEYNTENGTLSRVGGAVNNAAGSMGNAVSGGIGSVSETMGGAANEAGNIIGDTASTVGDAVSDAAGTVGETVGQVAGGTQGAARDMVTEVQFQALRIGEGLQMLSQKNPLALGAAGLAVGALIGLAVPESQAEHRLMGGLRDAALDQAGETAQQALNKVSHVTGEVGQVASQIGHIATEVG